MKYSFLFTQDVRDVAGPRTRRSRLRIAALRVAEEIQELMEVKEASPEEYNEEAALPISSPVASGKILRSVRRSKVSAQRVTLRDILQHGRLCQRIGGRTANTLSPVCEEYDSDAEDFGRSIAFLDVHEDCEGQSAYHTAVSHLTDLSGAGAIVPSQINDENADAVFSQVYFGPYVILPAAGSFTGESMAAQSNSDSGSLTAQGTGSSNVNYLAAPTLMLTLPTPQIAQSPVFVPHSPITLAKYVEATTPVHMLDPLRPHSLPSSTSFSLSPAPPLPMCDRCCLAQLGDGVVCRPCEKQWLACKVWYQAHDGGRRRWLTEPYIKPAESTARLSLRYWWRLGWVLFCGTDADLHGKRKAGYADAPACEDAEDDSCSPDARSVDCICRAALSCVSGCALFFFWLV
ncbi:hypothetical protein BN946_scf185013.g53 [Trametes cinnabarina]|uniref:Uncharacterized protein n=1 Tax=Pycnoporus cinnabarinus TaxID=5643 RepID=A0A060SMG9_PYCCI|nr:hypothetical protein BN946_scf185013.g53 [Trametes cinnabarina]